MAEALKLPIIVYPLQTASPPLIQSACMECGFFYVVNHGVEEELLEKVFDESRKFFSLPLEEKMKLGRKEHRGYTPLYAEKLDPPSTFRGDPKESFYLGPLEGISTQSNLNQWPSEEVDPSWRRTMESYYKKVLSAGERLLSLIAQALNMDEDFFVKVGALDEPNAFLRLLHYTGELGFSNEEICSASAHSDYGMITLLATNGIPGLQVCREKSKQPQVWEDVPHINGAFIINVGDMMERWTNYLLRSTLHRVLSTGQERYSLAFFFDPSPDCVVECLEGCCSESSPPRFPPILSGNYLKERLTLTYS